ncbi:hypothetical protein MIR68_005415 [Amoeboaphelidium protococcarum]|nr:hypothetical protein MIR68_005415 [Amoeboaphelidium protococcarum]
MSELQRLRQEVAELRMENTELRRRNDLLETQLNELRDGQRLLSWQRVLSIAMEGFDKYPSSDWVPAMSAARQNLLPLLALLYARSLRLGIFQSNRNLPQE